MPGDREAGVAVRGNTVMAVMKHSTAVGVFADQNAPWYRRPLTTRFLLAVGLMTIAIAGIPTVQANLHALDESHHRT